MKKVWLAAGLCAAVLAVSLVVTVRENHKLQQTWQETRQELEALTLELEAALEKNGSLEIQAGGLAQRADALALSADTLEQIEEGFAQRIRNIYSASDMEVLAVYQVGEDTPESIRRFFLCNGRYYTEYYLVDYVTGEICDLTRRTPSVKLASFSREQNGMWPNGDMEWEFRCEDYDGDGQEDILLVPALYLLKRHDGDMLLWLQRHDSFLPVNQYYCGDYTGFRDNEYSEKIYELEQMFQEEKIQEAWCADTVGSWLREEFFAGQMEELEAVLQDPKAQLHYTQWREPLDIHVMLSQNAQGQYWVRIPENPYGEEQINRWLQEFYEREAEREKEFMGVGIKDDDPNFLSEKERLEAGFYCSFSYRPERVDDAVVCLTCNVYYYMGGAHGFDNTTAVVFDTRSGKPLQLKDVVRDSEKFCDFAMDYFNKNYERYFWEREDVRDALLGGRWCFTDYGFRVCINGSNGLGLYEYEIPYELLLDHLKEDYLPVTRAAEFNMYMEGRAWMDVNGDGLVDIVTQPALEDVVTASGQVEKRLLLSVNETVTELDIQWQGKPLSELNFQTYFARLKRQEDGVTRLFWKVDIYGQDTDRYIRQGRRVYVYRFEGEDAVFEEDYEMTDD